MLDLAVPIELRAAHELLNLQYAVVRQPEFPQRYFKLRFLDVMRIKTDRDQDEIPEARSGLSIPQYLIVPGIIEPQRLVGLQRRIVATDVIEP